MFDWVGKQAVDGSIARIQELINTKNFIEAGKSLAERVDIKTVGEHIPIVGFVLKIWPDICAGYDAMTPEQKAAFWTNMFILGTKLAAMAA